MRKQHELHPLSSPNFFRFFFLAVGRHLALLKIFRPPVTHSLYSTRPALHSAAHVAACLPSLPQPRRPFFGISSVAVTDLGSATKMPTGYRIGKFIPFSLLCHITFVRLSHNRAATSLVEERPRGSGILPVQPPTYLHLKRHRLFIRTAVQFGLSIPRHSPCCSTAPVTIVVFLW